MKLHIIYVHGLDSSNLSTKSQLLRAYAQKNHPEIKVHSPDLNMPPEQVVALLTDKITELRQSAPVVLIGSSLGGFFSTYISNLTACPIFLLNPSTQPHMSLQRFFGVNSADDFNNLADDIVGTETTKGWQLTVKDMKWFIANQLDQVSQADNCKLLLKTGDEVLDYKLADAFYRQRGVSQIDIQQGGDHRITDFTEQLPMIMQWLMSFATC